MSRDDFRDIIRRVVQRMDGERGEMGQWNCVFNDGCDTTPTPLYMVREES